MSWRFNLINRFENPPGGITEGPAWNGELVLFTHIHASRIYGYNPKSGEFSVHRENTNFTNGLAFNAQGQLFGCCQNGRAIVRFDADGGTTTIADNLDGVPLNTPNDLAIDIRGRIWFTNPWNAGNVAASEVEQLDHRSVLCAVPQADGSYKTVRSTTDTTMPNGILVSPDGNTLYVAESNSDRLDIDRELRAYPITGDGAVGTYTTLHTFGRDATQVHRGIDGMCLDADGNIIATAGWPTAGRALCCTCSRQLAACWRPTPSLPPVPPTCASAVPTSLRYSLPPPTATSSTPKPTAWAGQSTPKSKLVNSKRVSARKAVSNAGTAAQ